MRNLNSGLSLGISALIVIGVIAAAGFGLYLGTSIGNYAGGAATSRISSCDYVIPALCPTGYNFTLSISYDKSWNVTYEGYNSIYTTLGNSPPQSISGSFTGSGNASRVITVPGSNNGWRLCALAEKLDSTNSTLVLSVGGVLNETSSPYGVTTVCQVAELV